MDMQIAAVDAARRKALSAIDVWSIFEILSPRTFSTPDKLAHSVGGRRTPIAPLPWSKPVLLSHIALSGREPLPPIEEGVFFHVVLGSIDMKRAGSRIMTAFGMDEERHPPEGSAVIASIVVDHLGRFVGKDGVGVSSFAWGLPRALAGDLEGFVRWRLAESLLVGKIMDVFDRIGDDGERVPVDQATIDAGYAMLVKELELPEGLHRPGDFSILVVKKPWKPKAAKNGFAQPEETGRTIYPPGPLSINSFLLDDLAAAHKDVASGKENDALARYLGIVQPQDRVDDVLRRPERLADVLEPQHFSAGKWPSGPGRQLVLLQQAAVNAARIDMAESGIMGVNGPPGTGKTTLLREIVAGNIVDRAMAMVRLDDPRNGFVKGPGVVSHVDPSLRGFEMVVASSNNRAVENISQELPLVDAVARNDLDYFSIVSDAIAAGRKVDEMDEEDIEEGDAIGTEATGRTWGLVSAVLGKNANKRKFAAAYRHKDVGILPYLRVCQGFGVEDVGPQNDRRPPRIVTEGAPPRGIQAAMRRWKDAKDQLEEARRAVDDLAALIETARSERSQLVALEAWIAASRDAERAARAKAEASLAGLQSAERDVVQAEAAALEAAIACEAHQEDRPPGVVQWTKSGKWAAWEMKNDRLAKAARSADAQLDRVRKVHMRLQIAQNGLEKKASDLDASCIRAEEDMRRRRAAVAAAFGPDGGVPIDAAFFAGDHDVVQTTSPWMSERMHAAREEMFVAAMAVHKAFVEVNAGAFMRNLELFLRGFMFKMPNLVRQGEADELWATLFLLVPVVSTTFASLGRMLRESTPGSIGWLLVDEAGQAAPQQAIAGIRLARRTIAVGDPLQVPPVVSLPQDLIDAVCELNGLDSVEWAGPAASVQTMADAASRFRATFGTGAGRRSVGMPLLVHRRCQEPMFGISNAVAYDCQMVHRTNEDEEGVVAEDLGPTRWIDVRSTEFDEKWCPEEGAAAIALIRKLEERYVSEPDIFIISPFKKVATEMSDLVRRSAGMSVLLGCSPEEWAKDRIGTVHTFQGREAECVILVLGAGKAMQRGAREWASGTPNILNVAVSRAKQRLYVVGNRELWGDLGTFGQLGLALPRR